MTSTFGLKHLKGITIRSANGAYCYADDGRQFLDLTSSFGPIILGHANSGVANAVSTRLSKGSIFSWSTDEHIELAGELRGLFPGCESVCFLKTGSEAVSAAVRVARAATGKNVIIRCGFHGWHDPLLSPRGKWHDLRRRAESFNCVPGVPESDVDFWQIWNGGDWEQLERLLDKHSCDTAGILIDPVQLDSPATSLVELRRMAHSVGALLILDEVKTGFRTSLGGVQAIYGVQADITVLSKALGNGVPIAAVLVAECWADVCEQTRIKGTYNSDLLGVVAGLETLRQLKNIDGPKLLKESGDHLIESFNSLAAKLGLSDRVCALPYRWSCMPHIQFEDEGDLSGNELSVRFTDLMAESGVLLIPNHMNFLNCAHCKSDTEFFLECADNSLQQMFSESNGP